MQTIVVGVDGGPGGRDALTLASVLRSSDSMLVATHVYPSGPFGLRTFEGYESEVRKEASELLASELKVCGVLDGNVTSRLVGEASPASGLHRAAENVKADLVVVGASLRGALERIAIGDTVRGVIQGSTCPVVIAPRSEGHRKAPTLRRIGVGFNGSPESGLALEWALTLADAHHTAIHLVSVVELPESLWTAHSYAVNWIGAGPDRTPLAQKMLDGALAEIHREKVDGEVVVGHAGQKLVDLSEHVDLLVLGSRGYGPLRRLLLGSTSSRVVDHAACPVVIVPRPTSAPDDPVSASTGAPAIA